VRSIRAFAKNMGNPYYEPTIVVHDMCQYSGLFDSNFLFRCQFPHPQCSPGTNLLSFEHLCMIMTSLIIHKLQGMECVSTHCLFDASNSVIQQWNSLPDQIPSAQPIDSFRLLLKNYYHFHCIICTHAYEVYNY